MPHIMPEENKPTAGFAGAAASKVPPRVTVASKADQRGTQICYYCCTMIIGKRYRVGPNLACTNCAAKAVERAAAARAAAAAQASTGPVVASAVGAGPVVASAVGIGTVDAGAVGSVTAPAGQSAGEDGAFVQGLVLGAAAAVVGLAFYAMFTIVTHFYVGYVALAVGWLIGKAIKTGSKGVGGPKYQVAAVVLTYAAISLAEIPILIARAIEHGASSIDWANMAPELILWGIASPFLQLRYGVFRIIGLVILFVGLRIAWRVTAAKRQVAASV
jgi:hypothetical protein